MMRLLFYLLFIIFYFCAPSFSSGSSLGNYLAARVAEQGNDIRSASEFYQRSLSLDSTTTAVRVNAFGVFLSNGDFDLALDLARDLHSGGEDITTDTIELSILVLSVAAIHDGDYSDAIDLLDYDWQQPLYRLLGGILRSWSYVGLSDTDSALSVLSSLEGPMWFNLFRDYHSGLILLSSNRVAEGLEFLESAYLLQDASRISQGTYLRVLRFLSLGRASSGDLDSGLSSAREALRLRPNGPRIFSLVESLESGDDIDTPTFTARLGCAEILLNLGMAINRRGSEHIALPLFRFSHFLSPKSDDILIELAIFYDRQDSYILANEFFSLVPSSSPLWSTSQLEIAVNLDSLGMFDESRDLFSSLISRDPTDSLSILTLSGINARHNRFEDSIPLLSDFLSGSDISAEHWRVYYRLGIAYERTDRWHDAELNFRQALDLSPDQPDVLNYLGYSWVDMGINLSEGLSLIQRAVNLRPNDGYMVDSLGWAYYRLGRFDDAVRELERALSLQAGDPTINDHLGDAYWRVGRELEATFQWRHALSFDPEKPEDIVRIEDKLKNGLPALSGAEVSVKP